MDLQTLKKQLIPNPEDVILVKLLFGNPGWKRFEERIQQQIDVLEHNIGLRTNGSMPVTVENLPALNEEIAERRMLKLILLLKDDLLDEVETQPEEVQEPKDFEVPKAE